MFSEVNGTHVPRNSYIVCENEWPKLEGFFIVYNSQNESSEQFKPVIVTIQSEVNKEVMSNVIYYCTHVYERFELFPAVLIIGKEECLDLDKDELNPHLVKFKSTDFWVHECLMYVSNLDIAPLNYQSTNAFSTLCHFLSHPDKTFSFLCDIDNQTINLLSEVTLAKH